MELGREDNSRSLTVRSKQMAATLNGITAALARLCIGIERSASSELNAFGIRRLNSNNNTCVGASVTEKTITRGRQI
jgi:hypothetical protein